MILNKHEREVQRLKGYLFGHFDSRGGSTLVIADNAYKAIEGYIQAFGGEDDKDLHEQLYDMAIDEMDQHKQIEIVVFDRSIELDGEVLKDYGGTHRAVWAQTYNKYASSQRWFKSDRVLILYTGPRPKDWEFEGFAKHKVKIQRADLGEDAFGLIVQKG